MRNKIKTRKNIRRKQKRRMSLCIALIIIVTTGVLLIKAPDLLYGTTLRSFSTAEKAENSNIDFSTLYSTNAVLLNVDTGSVLAEKGSNEKIYPASLTKIMTALLTVEHISDLDQHYQLPADIFQTLYVQNASMAGFLPDEQVSFRDLLYGALLPSGAECCVAFADYIAGSESAFIDLMNRKAAELGMNNTHFCNSTGLHDPDHYSTVQDLAVLLKYALNNQDFLDVFTSSSYCTSSTVQHPDGFTMQSTLFNNLESSAVNGGEILGGKTGYTQEAQLCLASLASVNHSRYILVTAHAAGSTKTEPFHIHDAINVYNQIGIAN